MKYVIHTCGNMLCAGSKDSCLHKMLGPAEEGYTIVQCETCGTFGQREIARRIKSPERQPWPYYNESAGVTFESESHEQKHVKENKLEAL